MKSNTTRRLVHAFVCLLLAVYVGVPAGTASATRLTPKLETVSTRTAVAAPLLTPAAANASLASYDLNLDEPRRNHTATVLADGRVLIVGGENEEGAVKSAELLDAARGSISRAASARTARTGHTATLLVDGTVLVAGGSNRSGLLRSTEIYDPRTDTFSPGPRLLRARAGHTATTLLDGRILVAGGDSNQTAEIFDPSARRFTLVAATTTVPRSFHAAIRMRSGDVLLAGGVGFYYGDTAEIFNVETSTFAATKNWLQVNRVRPGLQMLPDGKVQVIGGDGGGSLEIYDPVLRRFRNFARLSAAGGAMPTAQVPRARTWTAVIDGTMSDDPEKASSSAAYALSAERLARADYTYSELEGLGLGVIVGGLDRNGAFLSSVLLFVTSPASVTSDRVEYPLETNEFVVATDPVINGSGWAPGELVTVTREGSQFGDRVVMTAVADAAGSFSLTHARTAADKMDVYLVTAVGQETAYVAQSTYRIAASPDRESIERYTDVPPIRIKARIPINGGTGTIQTAAGPLNWQVTPKEGVVFGRAGKKAARPERGAASEPVAATPEPLIRGAAFEALSNARADLFAFSTSWSNKTIPPPELPYNPLPLNLTITSTGSLTGEAYLEVDSKFEGPECSCCWCWPPCECSLASASVSAAFVMEFDLDVTNDFTFDGTFQHLPFLVLPFAQVTANIPGTSFTIDASAGLYLGIKIETTGPMVVRTVLGVENFKVRTGVGAGFVLGIPPDVWAGPFFNTNAMDITDPIVLSGDGALLEFGGGELRPSLLVGAKAELNLFTVPIIDCDAKISAFIGGGPYLKLDIDPVAGLDPAQCQKFDFELYTGLVGLVQGSIGCGILSKTFSFDIELLETLIANLGQVLFKDPGQPTVTPSANIVVAAPLGQCTAVVSVPPAVASDVCTATTVAAVRGDGFALNAPYPVGVTSIVWTATDASGNTATATQTVTVTDADAPLIGSVTVSPAALWPPNHGMRTVTVNYGVTDCSAYTSSLSVSSNELVDGLGDGDTAPDWQVVDSHTVRLRAERSGTGSGRIYTIAVTAVDAYGNLSTRTVTVLVPFSQR